MDTKEFIRIANEYNVWATIYDKNTGIEVGNFTFGKRYHWWILYALAIIGLAIKYL